jgi:hypothetical protein
MPQHCHRLHSSAVLAQLQINWEMIPGEGVRRHGSVRKRQHFLLTAASFHFFGPSPRAILVGMIIVAVVLFAAGCFVAWRRLPLLPAAVFVVFCCLLVMMPANVGEVPNAYSFAKMVRVVDRTNLKGLAVPAEEDGLLAAFAAGDVGYSLLNRSRAIYPQFELSPFEYVGTILEAANLLTGKRYRRGGIALFDQVNPLPFMLGLRPPRGENLWLGTTKPILPVEQFFADIDPKRRACAFRDGARVRPAGRPCFRNIRQHARRPPIVGLGDR